MGQVLIHLTTVVLTDGNDKLQWFLMDYLGIPSAPAWYTTA